MQKQENTLDTRAQVLPAPGSCEILDRWGHIYFLTSKSGGRSREVSGLLLSVDMLFLLRDAAPSAASLQVLQGVPKSCKSQARRCPPPPLLKLEAA